MMIILAMILSACTNVRQQHTQKDNAVNQNEKDIKEEKIEIENLKLGFVPFMDSDIIITGTQNLPELLKKELYQKGYDVKNISIHVGTSYNATGEGMSAGSIDIAWLPAGTYAIYADDVEILLSATRTGLSNDSENPMEWNGEENATQKNGPDVSYYRSLVCATPSEYGKELAKKVNSGQKLTLEDLSKAKWGIQGSSSASGHIYPTLWLLKNYGKKISELPNVTLLDSGYGTAFLMAAAEQFDIITFYADARIDYEQSWKIPSSQADADGKQGMGREKSIWEEINVIGVTPEIYNVAITISKHSSSYSDEFKEAIRQSFLNLSNTEEGKKIFSIFNHNGYAPANDDDYQNAKDVLRLVSE